MLLVGGLTLQLTTTTASRRAIGMSDVSQLIWVFDAYIRRYIRRIALSSPSSNIRDAQNAGRFL